MGKSRRSKNDRKESFHGVYMNFNFVSIVTAYLGNSVKVHTISGDTFEGILTSFSPNFQVLLELVDKINTSSVVEKMVFAADDIVSLEIIDAEAECILNENFLNGSEISKGNDTCIGTEKVLQPWDCADESNHLYELDLTGQIGWNPEEMFDQNEKLFGVVSDFKEEMYTTPLPCQENSETMNHLGVDSVSNELYSTLLQPQINREIEKQQHKSHTSSIPVSTMTKKPKPLSKSKIPTISETSKPNQPHKSQRNNEVNRLSGIPKKRSSNYQKSELVINDTSEFAISVTKTTNDYVPLIPVNRPPINNSQLNPLAKEFTPSWSRPAFVTNFQVPYAVPCPAPMNTQSPILAAPFQLPVPYPTTQLYVWKPVTPPNFRH